MEILGIIATLFIILAFTMHDEVKIRLFDMIGAIIFVIYGIQINSISTVILNVSLIIIQIIMLYKIFNKMEEK